VFESGGAGVFPTPTDPFFLHVRTIDRVTGAWTELAKVQVPPGVSNVTTAVLGDAVTYIAYGGGADASRGASTTRHRCRSIPHSTNAGMTITAVDRHAISPRTASSPKRKSARFCASSSDE